MGYYEFLCQTELSIFVRLAPKITGECMGMMRIEQRTRAQRLNYNSMEVGGMQMVQPMQQQWVFVSKMRPYYVGNQSACCGSACS